MAENYVSFCRYLFRGLGKIVFLLVLGTHMLQAQQSSILLKGVVVDENKSVLPGVSIQVKGKNSGTITDLDGHFSINVPAKGDSVIFSYVGYIRHGIKVGNATENLRVQMIPTVMEMKELVVVAYGKTDRKSLTGSVAALSSADIERNRSNNLITSLQGAVPGLQLQSKAGPGGSSSTEIIIRGASSINGGVAPLFIVDGVPSGGDVTPDDVESISVLKDASAVSLYGARATNGVILITTKRGRNNGDKASVSYSGSVGISTRSGKDYKQVSSKDYYELTWEAMRNAALYTDKQDVLGSKYATAEAYASGELLNVFKYNAYNSSQPVGLDGKLDPNAQLLWWEDYNDILIKNGMRHEHNLNINGGTDRLKYYLSASYLDQRGLEPGNSGFSRFNTRLNMSYKVNKKLSLGATLSMSTSKSESESINNGYSDFATYARLTPGLYPLYKRNAAGEILYDTDGNKILDMGDGPDSGLNSRRPDISVEGKGVNPLATLDLDNATSKGYTSFMSFYGDWDLMKGLNLKSTYSANISNSDSKNYINRTLGSNKGVGSISNRNSTSVNWTWNSILSYEKNWMSMHRLRALAGMELNEKYGYNSAVASEGFLFDGMEEVSNGSTWVRPIDGNTSSKSRLAGFFSRVEYDYLTRYIFSASVRRDGASNFHRDSRWGTFWSVGGSWIFSSESFLKDQDLLSFGKLRASYGTTGNLGSNDYRSYYSAGYEFNGMPGIYISGMANKNLQWETNNQFNVGLDLSFINNRLRLTADWYNRKTTDLFYSVPLAPSIGFDKVTRNIGSLNNSGFEFSITSENIQKRDFGWTTVLNFSNNKNKILKLNQDEFVNGNRIYKEGKSTTEFYMQEYAGVDPKNGLPMWYIDDIDLKTGEKTGTRSTTYVYNETNSKTITLENGTKKTYKNLGRYYLGNYTPKIAGGFENRLRLKNFDLSFFFVYSLGSKVLMSDYATLMNPGNSRLKIYHQDMTNRWQNPGDITDVPRLSSESAYAYTDATGARKTVANSYNSSSSNFLRSGDYLKLRNVVLGYNFDNKTVKALRVSSARVYFQAENLFTLSAERGFDPEQVSQGSVIGQFPAMLTCSFGVKIGF